MDIGLGLMGTVGGNFQNKPAKTASDAPFLENPGFGGLTAGGGLMVDGRILDGLLGLEVDVLRTSDKGTGTINEGGASLKLTIGQGAWHVPILAKLTIPSAVVAPMFFLGPEFVFPSKGQVSTDPPLPPGINVAASADNYVVITGGGGVEIKLPLPILDLRIPIGLRFSYNPGLSSTFSDRTHLVGTTLTYSSEWKYAVNVTAGAALYF
jgi:hypothetical protein